MAWTVYTWEELRELISEVCPASKIQMFRKLSWSDIEDVIVNSNSFGSVLEALSTIYAYHVSKEVPDACLEQYRIRLLKKLNKLGV